MNKFKEYMSKPYSKGDYYGGIAAVALLYGGLAAAYFIKKKLDEKKFAPVDYVEEGTNAADVCEAVDNVEEEQEA